jgi:hypothetical protein
MNGRRLLIAPALAAVCCALLAGATQAAHAQLPQAGSTTTTTCRFAAGSTVCAQETVVISGGACYQAGERLYSENHLASSRTYRGNAVVSGLAGVAVTGDYANVVRDHAKLLDDSGVHAYSEGVFVDDPACG